MNHPFSEHIFIRNNHRIDIFADIRYFFWIIKHGDRIILSIIFESRIFKEYVTGNSLIAEGGSLHFDQHRQSNVAYVKGIYLISPDLNIPAQRLYCFILDHPCFTLNSELSE